MLLDVGQDDHVRTRGETSLVTIRGEERGEFLLVRLGVA